MLRNVLHYTCREALSRADMEDRAKDIIPLLKPLFNARYPKFIFFKDRLTTFSTWSKQMYRDKLSLAQAGLYYTGRYDLCVCFCCGVHLSHWLQTDRALCEHFRYSPECTFLKMIYCNENELVTRRASTIRSRYLNLKHTHSFGERNQLTFIH